MRVLTWNLHGLRPGVPIVAQAIAASGADFVCLQDIPRHLKGRFKMRSLARSAGYRVAVGGNRSANGLAILSRPRRKVTILPIIRLPHAAGAGESEVPTPAILGLISAAKPNRRSARRRGSRGRRTEHPMLVMTTHFTEDLSQRTRHTGWIVDYLQESELPTALAISTTEQPGGASLTQLSRYASDPLGTDVAPATHPADEPAERLDAVLVTADIFPVEVSTIGSVGHKSLADASTHLPVMATFEVPAHELPA